MAHDPDVNPNASGAPQAGGATTHGSNFGGRTLTASFLRLIARWSRTVEAYAYRALRDIDVRTSKGSQRDDAGRPNRVRQDHEPTPA